MFISRLQLKNIRCFENLTINFNNPGSSVLILGDNGHGKTTVLRCLAMGLCDENSAAALFRELPGEFVRRKPGAEEVERGEYGEIEVDLEDEGVQYRIVTRITSLDRFERVSQDERDEPPGAGLYKIENGTAKPVSESDFPWDKIFVSGYGAGTRTQGTGDFQHYLAVDAVYPLFSYTVALQNPELAVRRIIDTAFLSSDDPELQRERAKTVLQSVKELLRDVLDLQDADDVELRPTGIKVRGHWGIAELGELGDGYRSTVIWILDLVAWWFLNNVPIAEELRRGKWVELVTKEIHGIVIIDELEQHLHPRWQRNILKLLQESFPCVQFIVTSHSPLCALGTTELRDEEINMVVLQPADGKVEQLEFTPPRGKRADQILTSPLFGLVSTRSRDVSVDVARYAYLAGLTAPNSSEEAERLKLYNKLNQILGSEETDLQEAVRRAVDRALDEIIPEFFQENPPNMEALNFEVRRQLLELFGKQTPG